MHEHQRIITVADSSAFVGALSNFIFELMIVKIRNNCPFKRKNFEKQNLVITDTSKNFKNVPSQGSNVQYSLHKSLDRLTD